MKIPTTLEFQLAAAVSYNKRTDKFEARKVGDAVCTKTDAQQLTVLRTQGQYLIAQNNATKEMVVLHQADTITPTLKQKGLAVACNNFDSAKAARNQ